jgi:16S rRNA C1402 (ribose-2'-O) methylase RsmI
VATDKYLFLESFQNYEENARGTVDELIAHFKAKTVKGEIVVVLAGKED